jgi:hypothetical protein
MRTLPGQHATNSKPAVSPRAHAWPSGTNGYKASCGIGTAALLSSGGLRRASSPRLQQQRTRLRHVAPVVQESEPALRVGCCQWDPELAAADPRRGAGERLGVDVLADVAGRGLQFGVLAGLAVQMRVELTRLCRRQMPDAGSEGFGIEEGLLHNPRMARRPSETSCH